ncbi:rex 26 kD protein [Human T-lymphotropic virus 2]|uniref:Protein Rex n=2 Tax=Human T-cell leukemia virus 2 TaxID=11909 RepID=REX_HTLV2|nr:rex 26 kD protein [Human T-lymphotropic virus 2]Q85601.1 RecName: Full=Protein Rex; AltName: Full=Rev homolog; AltName: Full=Rex-2 [Human T-lymphotropic virus 2]AAB59886.1 rex 26 kD protein [Human T-lymphotropic virus 2]AAL30505.1 rex protein [Human T-lymphotropic virus 2]
MPKTRRQRTRRARRNRPPTPWPISQDLDRASYMDTPSTCLAIVYRPIGVPSQVVYVPPAYIDMPSWPPVQSTNSPGTPSMDALSALLSNTLSLASPPSPPREPQGPSRSLPLPPLLSPPRFHLPSFNQCESTPPTEMDAWNQPSGISSPPSPSPNLASVPKTSTPPGEKP